jgi:rhomboid protease GluP
MCPSCRAFITVNDKVCPYCDVQLGRRAVELRDTGALVAGIIPQARFVTVLILTLNLGIFAASVLASMQAGNEGALMSLDIRTLSLLGAARPDFVAAGQWWRLITAGFLHGGLMHIGFNMWALQDVGGHAEEVYGPRRMACIYLLSTVGGFFLSMIWSGRVSVGASAGLFGLIGAMIAVGVGNRSIEASMIRGFYVRWAVYGLLMGLLPFFQVDNAAHIGGLVTGFVCAYVLGLPSPQRRLMEQAVTALTGVVILVTAYAFLQMFLFYFTVTRR